MKPGRPVATPVELATLHGLTWLVVGCSVGLLLATLLLVPRLGELLSPLTYGRWMPVHLNLLLYGWCALPLVALLFRIYLPADAGRWPRLAVGVWSGGLVFAAWSWLAGHSSGKPFLEWTGPARILLTADLAFLAAVLVVSFARRCADSSAWGERRWVVWAKWLLLAGLLVVPGVIYWAAGPRVHPPINPASGGPTGGSLLGSTLGVVAILLLVPFACGSKPRQGRRVVFVPLVALAGHFVWFALLDHGNHSNREVMQIISLASLLVWFPLLARYLRSFDWPRPCRLWLPTLAGWSALLLATAIPTFLPGLLERWKFTNALVGHAHLAMAGFATSLVVVILIGVNRDTPLAALFAGTPAFVLWNAGNLVHVISLLVLGSIEGADPGLVFRSAPVVGFFYVIRWLAGATMLAASSLWLRDGLRRLAVSAKRRPEVSRAWCRAA